LRFVDLFCGIGGFRLGLKGHQCVYSCDIEPLARSVYWQNFGDEPDTDIRAITKLPAHDLLCAGFPCQSFSLSGNRRGFNDARGSLFFELVRIIDQFKPKYLLLENVPAILQLDGGNIGQKIMQTLNDVGYHINYFVLNSKDFGIPQSRRRVYFVGSRDERLLAAPQPTYERKYLKNILEDNVDPNYYLERDDIELWPRDETPKMKVIRIGRIRYNNKVHQGNYAPQGNRIYSINGVAITISSSTGLYKTPAIRQLTPLECQRVMGFPDDFKLPQPKTHAYRLLGNAVVPKMIKIIAKNII